MPEFAELIETLVGFVPAPTLTLESTSKHQLVFGLKSKSEGGDHWWCMDMAFDTVREAPFNKVPPLFEHCPFGGGGSKPLPRWFAIAIWAMPT